MMDIDLQQLRRQSRWAAVLTTLASIIILTSLVFSSRQTIQAKKELVQLQKAISEKRTEKQNLDTEIASLKLERDGLVKITNAVIATNPHSAQTIEETVATTPAIAAVIPRIYLQVPVPKTGQPDVNTLANNLRSAGFIVPAAQLTNAQAAPLKTQLRYFSDDPIEKKDIASIQRVLASLGVAAEVELIDKKANEAHALPRNYELWLGTGSVSKKDYSQSTNEQLAQSARTLAQNLRNVDAVHTQRDVEIRKSFKEQAAANPPDWRGKNIEGKLEIPIRDNIRDLRDQYSRQYEEDAIGIRDEIISRMPPSWQYQYKQRGTDYSYHNAGNDSDWTLYHDLKFTAADLDRLAGDISRLQK